MNPRGRVRGFLSALGLILLMVGVPLVLARAFGWPLPRGVPRWSEVTAALDDPSYIPDRFWIGAVAVVAWLGWAYLAAAVAVEVVARALHRPAPNVAIFARPVRELARRLVGSAALVTMLAGRPALAAPPPPPTPAAVMVAPPAAPPAVAPQLAASSVQAHAPVYVVQPWEATRDCLWTIAERHLGDPLRWREIWELNRGRLQHDGRALEEPDLILVGWELQLPADAVGVPAVAVEGSGGGTAASASATPTPAPPGPAATAPTTAPTTAAPTTSSATTAAPTTAAPTSTVAPATARASVSGIPGPAAPRPDATSTTATTSARREAATPVIGLPAAAAPVSDAAPSAASAEEPPSPAAVDERAVAGRKHGLATGAQLLGTGLLAAGVIATLDRLRRAQRRRRRAGERLPLPDPELAGVEWAARLGADASGAVFVELALRALVGTLRESGAQPPVVLAAQLGRRQLELVLAEPVPAPAPFQSREGGRRWALPRSTSLDSLEELGAEAPSPAPGLVTVGVDGTGAEVLIDLEEIGLVSVVGDEDVARELVLAAGVQLGVNEWRDWVSVVLVGFSETPLGLERVRVVGSLDEVLDDLEREAAETAELLADAELESTFEARVAGLVEDVWIPTLVLCASALDPEEAERLAAVATGPGNAGVGALVVGEIPGAAWELQVDVDELRIPQLGLTVRPQRLPAEEAAAVDELFEMGRRPLVRASHAELDDHADDERRWAGPDDEPDEPDETGALLARWGAPDDDAAGPEPEVDEEDDEVDVVEDAGPPPDQPTEAKALVRLLGPLEIEVDGELVPLDRGKAREALAYLASHRRAPVDGDRLCEALWPGQDPRKKTGTFNTTMWFVRNAVGATPDGRARLPKLRGRQRLYRLVADLVDVDYELLAGALRRARGERPEVARPLLRDALELVRGRPMEHVGKGHEWAYAEGLVYEMEATVADAAHRLAELCLDAGDAEGAHWAVRQGLRGAPGNEQLYRDQMHAANAAGNPAGVEAAWDELCRMAEEEEPYDGLDPATVATHRELSRRAAS